MTTISLKTVGSFEDSGENTDHLEFLYKKILAVTEIASNNEQYEEEAMKIGDFQSN